MPRNKLGYYKPSKEVFRVPKKRNYDSLEKAIRNNKQMPETAKQKALKTIARKKRGF